MDVDELGEKGQIRNHFSFYRARKVKFAQIFLEGACEDEKTHWTQERRKEKGQIRNKLCVPQGNKSNQELWEAQLPRLPTIKDKKHLLSNTSFAYWYNSIEKYGTSSSNRTRWRRKDISEGSSPETQANNPPLRGFPLHPFPRPILVSQLKEKYKRMAINGGYQKPQSLT